MKALFLRFGMTLFLALLLSGVAHAQAGGGGAPGGTSTTEQLDGCMDSGFYSEGRFINDLCWDCFFPMKIFGIAIPVGSRSSNTVPDQTAAPICICPGKFFGYPSYGISWGMWIPTHTIELTRQPWCSPTLYGEKLLGGNDTRTGPEEGGGGTGGGGNGGGSGGATSSALSFIQLLGGSSESKDRSEEQGSFYNFHWMSFPVGELINMLVNNLCTKTGADMDYLYFTEFDPTWTNEMLALYTNPEIKLFTKIYAHAACVADAVAATAHKPIDGAFWCAGTWGLIYPFAGKGTKNNNPEAQMLAGAHGLAAMHRRGLAKMSYGDKAICSNAFWFVFPKQQYQFQNMWPFPQKSNANWVGASSWRWGQWRNAPAVFEDRVITQWTYSECCITIW